MTESNLNDPAAFWNEKFGSDEYRYGTAPNAFMAELLPRKLKAGDTVLCIGDGEGRNGVWCAEQGYRTTSIEPSSVGAAKIASLAEERGVEVKVICDRMPSKAIEPGSFDAVVLTFIHAPEPMRCEIHASSIKSLRPGGILVLEAFTPNQRINDRPSGGPPKMELLFTPQMLRDDFQSLDIESLTEEVVELDEGHGHRGPADVVRLVGKRTK